MIYQANGPPRQAGVTTLISDKADFRPQLVRRDNDDHYILIKVIVHKEEIEFLTYICQTSAPSTT
jgi:hypothetical protein